ncbi:MAG: cytochrome c3 family protein [Rhodothermales bacterium]
MKSPFLAWRYGAAMALAASLFAGAAFAQDPAAVNPHGDFRADISCASCHTTSGWQPLRAPMDFDHTADAGFALTGSHRRASCAACHVDLQFGEPDVPEDACGACHLDVHQGALAGACVDCHTTTTFRDVDGLQAHLQTRFPLTGAHQQTACVTCHTDDRYGAFAPLENACDDCHHEDYVLAASIDHVAMGFSTGCDDCHTTLGWSGTAFDHERASEGYPLLGAHQYLSCDACHVTPSLAPRFTPSDANDCYTCHEADYTREHAGTGFTTVCLDCHTTDSWDGATFDHDSENFPIFSGEHRGKWNNDCQTCHDTPGQFMAFTCFNCHEHRQSSMDSEHRGVRNYLYDSAACYACHPRGREDD